MAAVTPLPLKKVQKIQNIHTNGHVPPNAVEVEQNLLGSLIVYPENDAGLYGVLTEDSFYDMKHARIFRALNNLHANNKAIDLITVTERLKHDKILEDAGGAYYITEITSKVPSGANADYYARIVAEKALARKLIETCMSVTTRAYQGDDPIDLADLLGSESDAAVEENIYRFERDVSFDPFPQIVYDSLPPTLKDITSHMDVGYERDLFLIGAFPVISSACPGAITKYGGEWQRLNLYHIVTAPASSGKSKIRRARRLGEPLDRLLSQASRKAREEYLAEKSQAEDNGEYLKESMPPYIKLFTGSDTSSRAIKDCLASNAHACIFETEIKTLAAALSREFGDYRDVFLKAFQNEPIEVDRATHLPIEIRSPALSVCITGTPGSFVGVIEDTEDGLYSRFSFYNFESDDGFLDQFEDRQEQALDLSINSYAQRFPDMWNSMVDREEPLYMIIDKADRPLFVKAGVRAMEQLRRGGYDGNLQANIKRSILAAVRLAGISAIARVHDNGGCLRTVKSITCTIEDIRVGLHIAMTMLDHAMLVSTRATKNAIKSEKKKKFVGLLPTGEFSFNEVRETAKRINVEERTARRWLKEMCDAGLVQYRDHDKYFKSATGRSTPSFRKVLEGIV